MLELGGKAFYRWCRFGVVMLTLWLLQTTTWTVRRQKSTRQPAATTSGAPSYTARSTLPPSDDDSEDFHRPRATRRVRFATTTTRSTGGEHVLLSGSGFLMGFLVFVVVTSRHSRRHHLRHTAGRYCRSHHVTVVVVVAFTFSRSPKMLKSVFLLPSPHVEAGL